MMLIFFALIQLECIWMALWCFQLTLRSVGDFLSLIVWLIGVHSLSCVTLFYRAWNIWIRDLLLNYVHFILAGFLSLLEISQLLKGDGCMKTVFEECLCLSLFLILLQFGRYVDWNPCACFSSLFSFGL